jgi:hypothetical protein
MRADRHTRRVTAPTRERAADAAGVVTLVIGAGLTFAPVHAARLLGLGDDARLARALGVADLVLAPGLLVARRRWRPMATRAALNLVIAAAYAREARRSDARRRARAGAVMMTILTVVDGALAIALRMSERELSGAVQARQAS